MKVMDINSNLHQCIKIGKIGGHVTGTIKAAIFRHVHSYMIIHTITDIVLCMKVIDLSLVSVQRLITCKKAIYIMRYKFYTETVQVNNTKILKNV